MFSWHESCLGRLDTFVVYHVPSEDIFWLHVNQACTGWLPPKFLHVQIETIGNGNERDTWVIVVVVFVAVVDKMHLFACWQSVSHRREGIVCSSEKEPCIRPDDDDKHTYPIEV